MINNKLNFLFIFWIAVAAAQGYFRYKSIPTNFDYYNEYHNQVMNFPTACFAQLDSISNDHTKELQSIISTYRKVILPNHFIYINKDGILLEDNSMIIGQKDTKLIMIPNDEIDFAVLNVHNSRDVEIRGVHIIGDRNSRSEILGQWGHGISVKGASNVNLIGLKIEQTIGDGIYIGQVEGIPSENVSATNIVIDNVRRNGLSITSGENIYINKLFASNSSGTRPMFGLDIEPNSNRDFIDNIEIDNVTTFNNAIGGLKININKLGNGQVNKIVNITVSNFQDYYSPTGLLVGNVTINPQRISGFINLKDLEFNHNYTPFQIKSSQAENLNIKLSNVEWVKPLRNTFTKKEVLKNYSKRKDVKIEL